MKKQEWSASEYNYSKRTTAVLRKLTYLTILIIVIIVGIASLFERPRFGENESGLFINNTLDKIMPTHNNTPLDSNFLSGEFLPSK